MIAANSPTDRGFRNTYNGGEPYRTARGRFFAPRERLEDVLAATHAVVDLPGERPTGGEFLRRIIRELRIRFYQPKSISPTATPCVGSCAGSALLPIGSPART